MNIINKVRLNSDKTLKESIKAKRYWFNKETGIHKYVENYIDKAPKAIYDSHESVSHNKEVKILIEEYINGSNKECGT